MLRSIVQHPSTAVPPGYLWCGVAERTGGLCLLFQALGRDAAASTSLSLSVGDILLHRFNICSRTELVDENELALPRQSRLFEE
jgi:hypothetical protein